MNASTLLLRQIHPSFVKNGRVTSQAFRPTPKDEDRLSVDDGDRITPDAAWLRYTERQGLASAGVCAVSVGECDALDLPVEADGVPYPEHCAIVFDALSNTQRETKAKLLRARATARDWLHRA